MSIYDDKLVKTYILRAIETRPRLREPILILGRAILASNRRDRLEFFLDSLRAVASFKTANARTYLTRAAAGISMESGYGQMRINLLSTHCSVIFRIVEFMGVAAVLIFVANLLLS
ncbi:MAG: hypothetical protein HY537_01615 [Deltaproteobacteria bacterium]|nr:hypothetical protein [Deltaproteobacteria bacterium]